MPHTTIDQNTFTQPWKGIHKHLAIKYGEELEKLSEQEKWRLIGTLANWVDFDLSMSVYGSTPISLAEYVGRFSTIHEDNVTVLQALQLICDGTDRATALRLIQAITAQLQSGKFTEADPVPLRF